MQFNKLKKAIWLPYISDRFSFFCWTVAWNKILTIENLRKRNLILTDCFCMGTHPGKSVDHLFLPCDFALKRGTISLACLRWYRSSQDMRSNFLVVGMPM